MTDVLAASEAKLRKRLDLRGARITRASRALIILVSKKHGGRVIERCLTLYHDGAWEVTEYPTENTQARLLFGKIKTRGRGVFLARHLSRIAAALGEPQTGKVAK